MPIASTKEIKGGLEPLDLTESTRRDYCSCCSSVAIGDVSESGYVCVGKYWYNEGKHASAPDITRQDITDYYDCCCHLISTNSENCVSHVIMIAIIFVCFFPIAPIIPCILSSQKRRTLAALGLINRRNIDGISRLVRSGDIDWDSIKAIYEAKGHSSVFLPLKMDNAARTDDGRIRNVPAMIPTPQEMPDVD
ncbi:hypothetical protein AAMO2058_001159700 [Amorphochlora amoebiformis]|eukprot:1394092-Amorphochlora_amoeboformis.AAC.1